MAESELRPRSSSYRKRTFNESYIDVATATAEPAGPVERITSARLRTFSGPYLDVEKAAVEVTNGQASSRERLTSPAPITASTAAAIRVEFEELEASLTQFWDRFTRRGKKNVPIAASLRAIVFSSWLNLFVVFIPLAWVGHFASKVVDGEKTPWLFDWGGEQMAPYLGSQLGDLVVITLNNVVEASLAIILLLNCEVLSLLLPAAFFSAIDHGAENVLTPDVAVGAIVNDATRDTFLVMSRGLAVILLALDLVLDEAAPEAMRVEEKELRSKEPEVNQYVLIVVLVLGVAIMAATTEWLVESINYIRDTPGLVNRDEWFGMVLLPILSWAANGFVAIVFFIRYVVRHFFEKPSPPTQLAKARAIDLSIQFTLFWMPFLVILGWWAGKPMSLLFDFFEIAVLLGSCFIVNYVTADAKTNWAEGFAMALCAWFYTGQSEIKFLLSCQSVADTLASFTGGSTAPPSVRRGSVPVMMDVVAELLISANN
ncbi:hypothetical protein H0H92_006994 [Tricholoma furcatifolium]|nr:hypothetical protein H0H92_006994 [Tricholoma furcatifolium]